MTNIFNNGSQYNFDHRTGSINVMGNSNHFIIRHSNVAICINGNSNSFNVESSEVQFSINGNSNFIRVGNGANTKVGINGNSNQIQKEDGGNVSCLYANGDGNEINRSNQNRGREPNRRNQGQQQQQRSRVQQNQPQRNQQPQRRQQQMNPPQSFQYPIPVNPFMNAQFQNYYELQHSQPQNNSRRFVFNNYSNNNFNNNNFQGRQDEAMRRGLQQLGHGLEQLNIVFNGQGIAINGSRGRAFNFHHQDSEESEEEYHHHQHEEDAAGVGLTQFQLELLPTSPHQSASINCAICLSEVVRGEPETFLFCMHSFHSECVFEWLRKNPKCPLCLQNIKRYLMQ